MGGAAPSGWGEGGWVSIVECNQGICPEGQPGAAYLSTHHIHDKGFTHTLARDRGTGWGGEVSLLLCHTKEKQAGSCPQGDCSVTEALRSPAQRLVGKLKSRRNICILVADNVLYGRNQQNTTRQIFPNSKDISWASLVAQW